MFTKTKIKDVLLVENKVFKDARGDFVKLFNSDVFSKLGMEIKESYYSVSMKDVIRGMHFQLPPCDHVKLVSVLEGSVLDVILDLRKNSSTYGKYVTIELSANHPGSLYIPKGCAHGFLSLEDNTKMIYYVSTVYAQKLDFGIVYDSFGFQWPVENPIVSERDKGFVEFNKFKSPFIK
ncbi:MAG: dTDP-4-dehydrorhamnose 3,5-epimerase [Candidatus Omnitrophica bacterium]|nr:dTDP-4-dehydrorhamnose 3,5-epimerase [Candidatus Omnitrophota bacterium]MDD5081318.1 dTDP-4-dehydrorhamnose 3,5-epimerase [Candidatus Omnitrophota bacterium]